MSDDRYLIAIATYKRPPDLRRLLESVRVSTSGAECDVDVVVVDNDPEGSALETVDTAGYRVTYAHEPDPGIASARNAGLRHFTDEHAAVVFVDDDEWVDANWFTILTDYWRSSSADVVQGVVISIVPSDAPGWIKRGGFYQRTVPPTGTQLLSAATNNTLLSRRAWERAGCPRFDRSYSETGGSDWEFFWGIRRSGAVISICAEARAFEDIPGSRLSYRWLARRAFRSGIVHTRVRLKHRDLAVQTACRGVARMGMYLVRLIWHLTRERSVNAKYFNEVHFELGRISGLFGVRVYEYRRRGKKITSAARASNS